MTSDGDAPKPMQPGDGDGKSTSGGICGARTRSGGICSKPGLANGRCRNHGGMSPTGVKSPQFKSGRYSRALKRLEQDIGDRVNAPDLLDPRRSIAVQEATMARLGEMLDNGDSPEFREGVRTRLRDALAKMREDPSEGVAMLGQLRGFVERGAEESRALAGMGEAADKLNRSQVRYWQTAMSAGRSISPEEFIGLMFRLSTIITDEVDRDAARRILERTDRELCGGALGLARGAENAAPTSGD